MTRMEKLMEGAAQLIVQEGGKVPLGYEGTADAELFQRESYYLSVFSMIGAIEHVFRDDMEYITRLLLEMNIGLAKATKVDLFRELTFEERFIEFKDLIRWRDTALRNTTWIKQIGNLYACACSQEGNKDFIQFGMDQFYALGAVFKRMLRVYQEAWVF